MLDTPSIVMGLLQGELAGGVSYEGELYYILDGWQVNELSKLTVVPLHVPTILGREAR